MAEGSSNSSRVGFCSLLTLLFIALKLLGKIDWSWWWVLSPAWIPLVLFVIVAAVIYALFSKEWGH